MKSTDEFIVEVMAEAEKHGISITEIEMSEAQVDYLIRKHCTVKYPWKRDVGSWAGMFNGARIVTRPEPMTPEQKTAKALRALADELEKK